MKQTAIAERYAEALFELAQEEDAVDRFADVLKDILETIGQYPDLGNILYHPVIKKEDKKEVLQRIFELQIPASVLQFLYLLVDKKREKILPDIATEYEHRRNALHQTVMAEVVTAIPMYKKTSTLLQKELETYLGQQVVMDCQVDESILGGIMVKIEDRLIDASVRTQLRELAQTLI